ncbi:MAG: hypothetical protein IIV45_14525 [Lachnospiraceae bacterium]|nr:hypothetical protein [Lachnospiraceae bacterium]
MERIDLSEFDTRTTADYEYATWCSYEEYIKTAVIKAYSVKSTYFWFNGVFYYIYKEKDIVCFPLVYN